MQAPAHFVPWAKVPPLRICCFGLHRPNPNFEDSLDKGFQPAPGHACDAAGSQHHVTKSLSCAHELKTCPAKVGLNLMAAFAGAFAKPWIILKAWGHHHTKNCQTSR